MSRLRFVLLCIFAITLLGCLYQLVSRNYIQCLNKKYNDASRDSYWHARRAAELKRIPGVLELLQLDDTLGALDTLVMMGIIALKIFILWHLVYKTKSTTKKVLLFFLAVTLSISINNYTHTFGHNAMFSSEAMNLAVVRLLDIFYYGTGSVLENYANQHSKHHDEMRMFTHQDVAAIPTPCEDQIIGSNPIMKILYVLLTPLRIKYLDSTHNTDFKGSATVQFLSYLRTALFLYFAPTLCVLMLLSELVQFAHPFYPSITEHVDISGQPTNSYYGLLNLLTYNLYHHVEHHDFPDMNPRNFPKLRELAPHMYEHSIHSKIGSYLTILLSPYCTLRECKGL